MRLESSRGFSLLEVLFAMTIATAGVMSVAQLLATATHANRASRATTISTVVAARRMEQLRALTWGFDATGLPLSDLTTDLTVEPPSPAGGTGLAPSPDDTLTRNADGYFDWVDGSGWSLGGGSSPPPGAVYTRRWAVTRLSSDPDNSVLLQVRVIPRSLSHDVRLVALKTRKAW